VRNLTCFFYDSIAGAGSGIGREVCRVLAREGANVVAADQNIKTAQETVASLEGLYILYIFLCQKEKEDIFETDTEFIFICLILKFYSLLRLYLFLSIINSIL